MLLRVTAMDYQRCKNFFLHAFVGLPCLYLDTTKTLFTKTKKRFPTVGGVAQQRSFVSFCALGLRWFDSGTEQQLKSGGEGDTRQRRNAWTSAAVSEGGWLGGDEVFEPKFG
jgi:hypothetical protein